jgi:hypothetical protein
MLSIAIILDIVKLAAGVVLTYFVLYLYQKEFRSSVMEKGFRMIAISMLILTAGRIFDLISTIQPTNLAAEDITTVLGTAFSLVLVYGFYLVYRIWHIDKKEPPLEKSINA